MSLQPAALRTSEQVSFQAIFSKRESKARQMGARRSFTAKADFAGLRHQTIRAKTASTAICETSKRHRSRTHAEQAIRLQLRLGAAVGLVGARAANILAPDGRCAARLKEERRKAGSTGNAGDMGRYLDQSKKKIMLAFACIVE